MFVAKLFSFSLIMLGLLPATNHVPQKPLSQNDQIIAQKNERVTQKEQNLYTTHEEIRELEEKKRVLAQQLEDEKKTAESLRKKIADKKAAKAAEAAKAAQATQAVAPVFSGPRGTCGDNQYSAYIYGMESGGRIPGNCNTTVRNAEGCIGIGQACPASKLIAVCPNLDYECENAFFTSYALSRYGGWAGAYQWWLSHKWW